jgi:phosphoribosylformimino-5-aminoimidazole carboxamide ribotide isomerase
LIILPEIDLYRGKAVSSGGGTPREDDPYTLANSFAQKGCTHLHIIDQEGAKMGRPRHLDILAKISRLGMFVEYGGGLRSRASITDVIRAGAWRAVVGSILFNRDDMAMELYQTFNTSLMPAIDVKGNRVVISGWYEHTGMTPATCLARLYSAGFRTFLVTSAEDGETLNGLDIEIYKPLVGDTTRIVAAGGVTTMDDILKLKEMGVAGVVVERALYDGNFDLEEAIRIARD